MNIAYNVDCMEYMRSLPDKAFDLAVVDPPYGDGCSQIGNVERERAGADSEIREVGLKGTGWNRFGPMFDKYKERVEVGRQSTVKKSWRGMLPQRKSILGNCSAFHAIKSFGVATISGFHRPAVSLYGAS